MAHSELALLPSILLFLWPGLVVGLASTLQQVTDFGINPTNVGMFIYIPTSVTANPAVFVAIHDCNGTAQTYFASSPYPQFADTYGCIVIYPSSPNVDTCWDVTSPATLTHGGGGDSQGNREHGRLCDFDLQRRPDPHLCGRDGFGRYGLIVILVLILTAKNIKIGTMTSILMATYPELWRTATIYSGAAAGCFDYWAAVVRAMYPGYNGTYPPVRVWYSSETSFWTSYAFRAILEWSSILGCDILGGGFEWLTYPTYSKFVSPLLAKYISPVLDDEADPVPTHGDEDMAWFGIDLSLAQPPVIHPPPPLPPANVEASAGTESPEFCLADSEGLG
ncbi:hypothetical protein C8J57DRAFT_1507388 [Mycena rebaudengoi]|nr:hypothetical protein C8J57DRAFT_1507388 [Mycena rebaudengoi]